MSPGIRSRDSAHRNGAQAEAKTLASRSPGTQMMRAELPGQGGQTEGEPGDQRSRDEVVSVERQAGHVGQAESGKGLRVKR